MNRLYKNLMDAIEELYIIEELEPNWNLIVNQLKWFMRNGMSIELLCERFNKHMINPSFNLSKCNGGVGFLSFEPNGIKPMTKEEALAELVFPVIDK